MPDSLLIDTAFIPGVVSIFAAGLLWFIGGTDRGCAAAAGAIGIGFITGYLVILGPPPAPPNASIQKLFYVVAVGVILGVLLDLMRPQPGVTRALGALAPLVIIGWFVWRRLFAIDWGHDWTLLIKVVGFAIVAGAILASLYRERGAAVESGMMILVATSEHRPCRIGGFRRVSGRRSIEWDDRCGSGGIVAMELALFPPRLRRCRDFGRRRRFDGARCNLVAFQRSQPLGVSDVGVRVPGRANVRTIGAGTRRVRTRDTTVRLGRNRHYSRAGGARGCAFRKRSIAVIEYCDPFVSFFNVQHSDESPFRLRSNLATSVAAAASASILGSGSAATFACPRLMQRSHH